MTGVVQYGEHNDIARGLRVMVQRKAMDHRSWGSDKTEDREYAKALRDHAETGSTQPLVEVEITTDTLTDGDLLAFGRSKRGDTATDAMWRHVVCVALGLTLEHDEGQNVASARKRIAAQIDHDAKLGIRRP